MYGLTWGEVEMCDARGIHPADYAWEKDCKNRQLEKECYEAFREDYEAQMYEDYIQEQLNYHFQLWFDDFMPVTIGW